MNFDDLKKITDNMQIDVNTNRLVPNYKDRTNLILEKKIFVGDPI